MTDKQKLFVDEYLKCMNVTRAYKKVYKNVRSDSVARSAGNRLLSKPDVKAYKKQRMQERLPELPAKPNGFILGIFQG